MNVRVNDEVKAALAEKKPVIALESTIISHGMPYPQNVQTALAVEKIIRDHGAIPATIGIIDGVGVVGMLPEEIEEFGRRGMSIPKVSRRDLPVILARGSWGATTVATTMILAAEAGVEFFVTGGIGGVHRGAENTFDISADLEELARTNVTVICAGAKAILDLPKTLEVLETKGVPVLGYQTQELPAFYTRKSGLKVDYELKDAEDAAVVIKAKREFGLTGGILITNPVPEEYSYDADEINAVIDDAVR
ncbi:MAG: pseudouridine-5'-phosphate glycosidase, partial [Solobacterium sp.]|nr:pseudouridine-5'-phosphate glycosidase [Solobacterium sp.]